MSLSVQLRHGFPDFSLDVAFDAPAGVTALFGRSGSGKTTVINAVAGLLKPSSGRVVLNGRVLLDTKGGVSVPVHRRRVGYVFQDARLFPHLTVRQNLLYGRRFAPTAPLGVGFDQVVALLGISPLLDRRPAGLSGGEKQRVAIGRALLSNPQLLLMDEPLAALDDARKAEILPYLERLRDQTAVPILYVSHALTEVARLATTLVLIDSGRIVKAGPVADVLSDPLVMPALGPRDVGALLPAIVTGQSPDGLTEVATSAGPLWVTQIAAMPGAQIRVRIAAQDVILSRNRPEGLSALNIFPALVMQVQADGPGALVQLRIGNDLILARITRRSAQALSLTPGTACHAILKTVAIVTSDIAHDAPSSGIFHDPS